MSGERAEYEVEPPPVVATPTGPWSLTVLLCHRCGSHVSPTTDTCPTCGLKYNAASRQAAGAARRRGLEGAPYKPGDVVAGRYAIREVVGSGPMGFVFRAQDQEIDVELALKVVHPRLVQQPEERTQFSLSLRVGKKLNHANLLRVYEEGMDGERPFFTMQLLEGMPLRRMLEQRVSRGQLFSLKDVEPLLAQMAAALDAAHRFGPHSDFKPENVIVLPDLLKVTDYGLGLAVPHLPFAQAQKGHRADAYIAPEYVVGGELDTRMDVYSLGVIMGELVTGLLPEEGVIPGLTLHHPDLPTSFEALYRRALNPNPLVRPKTAGDLHAEFVGVLSRSPAAVVTRQRAPLSAPGSQTAGGKAPPRPPPPPPVPTSMLPAMNSEPSPLVMPPPGVAAPRPVPPVEEEPPPPDATQPLDSATLSTLMKEAHPSLASQSSQRLTEQALPVITLPAAKAPAHPAPRPTGPLPTPGASSRPPVPASALGASPRPSGVAAAQPRSSAARMDDARSSAQTPGPSPVVSGARSGTRTLDSSPPMSGARSGTRRLDPSTTCADRSEPRIAALPTQPTVRVVKAKPRSRLWLVLLIVGGLGLGGGYVLMRLRQPVRPSPLGPGASARTVPPDGEGTAPSAKAAPTAAGPVGGCASGMRLVSGGSFEMGTGSDDDMHLVDEHPLTSLQVPSFCVDEYEYPNEAGAPPKVEVTWEEALALCKDAGKRLCTEPEWEKACKGPGNVRFPYGNPYDVNACNTEMASGGDRMLATSGQFNRCRSGYGVMDLSGNVEEWTATRFDAVDFTQKGGAFNRPDYASRCSARKNGDPSVRSGAVGFRCCADVRL